MQEVKYEWKPIHCHNCGGMGYDTEKCKRLLWTRNECVQKITKPANDKPPPEHIDDEGFMRPKHPQPIRHVPGSETANVELVSTFQSLNAQEISEKVDNVNAYS